MMLYPSVFTLIKGDRKCRYSLVIAVAKKAREISDVADAEGDILTEKPVSMAIECLESGEMDYFEPLPGTEPEPELHHSEAPVLELDTNEVSEKEDKEDR